MMSSNNPPEAAKVSFEDEASFLSKCFMFYLNPLFKKGYNDGLVHADLGLAAEQDRSALLYDSFIVEWEKEVKLPREKRSLWNVLWRTVGYGRLSWGLILYGAFGAVSFGPILILNKLTRHFQGDLSLTPAVLWIYVVLMFVLPSFASLLCAHSNIIMAHMGLQFRNALINMIYRKALRLSPASRQQASTGQIVNMFSNDTVQLQRFLFFLNNSALAPAQIAVALALIYQLVGPSTFVGLAFMLILMPMNGFIFGFANAIRRKKVKVSDVRVKLTNEILSGIRVIKYYAWELAFAKKVNEVREEELIHLKHLAYIIAVGFTLILMSAPIVQPILIFYTYVKLGNQLDAAKAFTTIALFNLMQMPFTFLPLGLAQYSQSIVSTTRMLDFFVAEELEAYLDQSSSSEDPETVIKFDQASLGWLDQESQTVSSEQQSKTKSDQIANAKDNTETKISSTAKKEYEMVATHDAKDDGQTVEINEDPINRSVYTLDSISFSVKKGELVAIVGSVGSGKSSILSALLGEMRLRQGKVQIVGSVAFCDQRPWILNGTVRDNILFGSPYEESKFDVAMHAANLEEDIKILPGGILTEIGERGINLSGGQKARVALARAVYRMADIYLLDDPLSAVDAHVGQHLFQECLVDALRGKTRILVTHQVHFLPKCDRIVVIENGKLLATGSYQEIQAQGIDFSTLVVEPDAAATSTAPKSSAEEDGKKTEETEEVEAAEEAAVTAAVAVDDLSVELQSSELQEETEEELQAKKKKLAEDRKKDDRMSQLISMEERRQGDVPWQTYRKYLQAGGSMLFVGVVFIMLLGQALQLGANFWLSYWGQQSIKADPSLSTSQNLNYLNIFAALSCAGLATYVVRSFLLAGHRIGTSVLFHHHLLNRVLHAPLAFFDVTPLGRILNRFSSDLLTLDEELTQTISQVANAFFACLGALGAIAGATKGTFLIVMVPMLWFYRQIQQYFRRTNTTLARLESVSRSPMYADFSQALNGLTSIRAYGDQKRFTGWMMDRVDSNSIAGLLSQIASQWLAVRLDFLGAIITFFIAILATLSNGFIPAGFLALGLMYSFQMTSYLKFLVRMLATGEAQMNSVERILFYVENIPQEGVKESDSSQISMDVKASVDPSSRSCCCITNSSATTTTSKVDQKNGFSSVSRGDEEAPGCGLEVQLPAEWPSEGCIELRGMGMRYRGGPLVLSQVSAFINSKEKVGIAGRTGSGKSSLLVALFRMEECAEGQIIIDGVDIAQVPLAILRSRLGIIPQDPVLFSASVRFNLDPFQEFADELLWKVLEQVNMKDVVLSLPNKLEEMVAEGGDNFSAGQRQLICIGRALLRRPKILVLDEATASIDNDTDNLVQKMVRENFKDSTVLTIAHRLHTIIDSDRIMVLDQGRLMEYDSPSNLLAKEQGLFKSLWKRHQASHNK